MAKAVKLHTSGRVEIIGVPEDFDWRWAPQQIGVDYMEIVHPRGLHEPLLMVVDEEGALKDRRIINPIASWLYGAQDHGIPIFGDALIMQEVVTEDGPDIGGLQEADASTIQVQLQKLMAYAVL